MTAYEMGKYWLTDTLENYRDTPPEAWKRDYVDRLIAGSRRAAGGNETEKKYHNLIVLRYITNTLPPKLKICKALHVGRQNYETETAHAIDRLLVLAFGIDGIDWNGEAQAGGTDETP